MMSVVDENKLYAIKFPGRSEPIELVMYVTTNFRNFPAYGKRPRSHTPGGFPRLRGSRITSTKKYRDKFSTIGNTKCLWYTP